MVSHFSTARIQLKNRYGCTPIPMGTRFASSLSLKTDFTDCRRPDVTGLLPSLGRFSRQLEYEACQSFSKFSAKSVSWKDPLDRLDLYMKEPQRQGENQ